ncbi:hypothetical protein [Aquipluma nitroreducens]|nr:hypothetical protein [Aquipluma nitroreducens]
MTTIEKILIDGGPMMSSELVKKLEIIDSIPNNTASQRVARNKKIEKIKGFFKSNQSLCFLPIHEKDGGLFSVLITSLFENGRKYWYCLNAIRLHGGVIERKYLECFTNYPILPLKKHLPFEKVMQMFISEGILAYSGDYYYLSPKLGQVRPNSLANTTVDLIKSSLLTNFGSLTKNIGLISYNSGETFAEYGKFRWAFKGVSTVTGLVHNGNTGFLLADIIIGTPIFKEDVLFFVEKIKHIQSFNNAGKLIPFLIVDDLDKEALLHLKQNGIVVGFIGELFGQKYADTLKELITILDNAGASLKKTPEKYLDLIKELNKYNEGLANNMRGTFFEFVVGHIHSIDSNSSIDLGREIFENGFRHEMDVVANYPHKIVIAECKAVKSKIDIETVDNWLGRKIPVFKNWVENQETWKRKTLEFEFWSTSGFTDEAFTKLQSVSSSSQRYKVSFFQSNDIRERAKTMKNKKLKEALDDFFLKIKV